MPIRSFEKRTTSFSKTSKGNFLKFRTKISISNFSSNILAKKIYPKKLFLTKNLGWLLCLRSIFWSKITFFQYNFFIKFQGLIEGLKIMNSLNIKESTACIFLCTLGLMWMKAWKKLKNHWRENRTCTTNVRTAWGIAADSNH